MMDCHCGDTTGAVFSRMTFTQVLLVTNVEWTCIAWNKISVMQTLMCYVYIIEIASYFALQEWSFFAFVRRY